MQIVPLATNLPPARPNVPGAGARAVQPITELLQGTPSERSEERVLQGEFLERGRDAQPAPTERDRLFRQRREDHPAFYPRYDNGPYVQRRAIAAYQAHTAAADEPRGGIALDDFI